jgi:hypothetical protein
MICRVLCLGSLCLFAWIGSVQADEEVMVHLNGKEDYGSGPSLMDHLYSPGGIENIGLFLGNPNTLVRRDRVLVKYNIKPLLLVAGRVKSAKIEYYLHDVLGPEDTREMAVEHFAAPIEGFEGASVNSAEVDEVAVVKAPRNESVNGEGGPGGELPQEVDVTEALKNSLARGDLFCGFRFKDVAVEGSGASGEAVGVIILGAENKLPVLKVLLND